MPSPVPTVCIIDDDHAICAAIESLVQTVGLNVQVFHSAQAFLETAPLPAASCVVIDVRMPGMNGLELQHHLLEQGLELPVIFLTAHGDVPMAVEAIKKGAHDFLEKPVRDQVLLDSIQRAVNSHEQSRVHRCADHAVKDRIKQLTSREREVLDLLLTGRTSKAIGAELSISPKTVDFHRAHIMRKMGVETVVGLTKLAVKAGLA